MAGGKKADQQQYVLPTAKRRFQDLLEISFESMSHIETDSKTFEWCRNAESNRGPTDYESVALPTELSRRSAENTRFADLIKDVRYGQGVFAG